MMLYIEKSINSTKKLLDLISEFGKIARCKVNIQISKAFLYTNNEITETKTKKNIPFIITKKVARNKLNQGGKRPVLRKLQNTEKRN